MSAAPPAAIVEEVISTYPEPARRAFLTLRTLIFDIADRNPDIGALSETLKWGEPSYVPKKPRTGTAVRLAWTPKVADTISLFVNCQTSLIADWRALYEDQLCFVGNREVRLPLEGCLPDQTLRHCVEMALTYHLRK